MRVAAVLCAALLTACGTSANATQPDQTQPSTTLKPRTTVVITTPATTTTTSTLVPADVKCAEWADEAVAGGWPADDLQLLIDVLDEAWNESRCLPIGADSPHFNGADYGIMQINRPTHEDYVVQLYGNFDEIVDPVTNFAFAWRLYSGTEARGLCGWKAWSRPCR
jgi:hypothetical protein